MELHNKRIMAAMMVIMAIAVVAQFALGDPTGSTISDAVNELNTGSVGAGRADARSTVTTMILTAVQLDQNWKAYVGNVTGSLTLDDVDDNTIYDWSVTSAGGEVYATRFSGLDFTTVQCADVASVNAENVFFNMTNTQVDSVNMTFNSTNHQSFVTAGQTLTNCPTTSLYVSDTRVTQSASADWQEVLIEDNANNLLFTSIINDNTNGFDDDSYDFQMIVAESDVNATASTYYFYVELDSV